MTSSLKSNISSISNLSYPQPLIPKSEYLQYSVRIKEVRYPTHAIDKAENIDKKIQSFKNENVRSKLKETLTGLNTYRKVRGDGNCFFRAIAFTYLSNARKETVQHCFPLLNQVKLTCCKEQSIPNDFRKFYDNNFLISILQENWDYKYSKYLSQSSKIHTKALLRLFFDCPYLDFIVILYFRAVCVRALQVYKNDYQDFITGGELTSIRTYSEETQGISINLCSRIFQINIFVYEIRKQQVQVYTYNGSEIRKQKDRLTVSLLFYQNHYDLLEQNKDIQSEQMEVLQAKSYYQPITESLLRGTCSECHTNALIYKVSNLCQNCQEASLHRLKNFSEEILIEDHCGICGRWKNDVSSTFGVCKSCVINQKKIQQFHKTMKNCANCGQAMPKSDPSFYCMFCSNRQREHFKNFKHQPSVTLKNGQCKVCRMKNFVRQDSLICQQCYESRQQQQKKKVNDKKFEEPVRKQSSFTVCNKCGNDVQYEIQGFTCKKCLNNRQIKSYQNFYCKGCNELSLNSSINGLCRKCSPAL